MLFAGRGACGQFTVPEGVVDTLKPVDSAEVLILVDNATDNLSSVPSFVETEFDALLLFAQLS
jgi:hypothetical protein